MIIVIFENERDDFELMCELIRGCGLHPFPDSWEANTNFLRKVYKYILHVIRNEYTQVVEQAQIIANCLDTQCSIKAFIVDFGLTVRDPRVSDNTGKYIVNNFLLDYYPNVNVAYVSSFGEDFVRTHGGMEKREIIHVDKTELYELSSICDHKELFSIIDNKTKCHE